MHYSHHALLHKPFTTFGMLTTWNCVPGLVRQAGWYGGTDCVSVVKGSELIVSQLLSSETQFQIDFFVLGSQFVEASRLGW